MKMANLEANSNNVKENAIQNSAVDFEEALTKTGFGRFNIIMLILCGNSLMAVIIETTNMSFILPASQCDLELTQSDKSILSATTFLGVVSSSLLWGFIGDNMGRRRVILITMYLSSLAGVISSFVPSVWMFIVFRYIDGFFIGGPSAVIYAYLSEFQSIKYRQRMVSTAGIFLALATIYLPAIAWGVLPLDFSYYIPGIAIYFRSWRLLLLICTVPSFLCATCLLYMPESPKFLWTTGRSQEALDVLRMMYASNSRKPASEYPIKILPISSDTLVIKSDGKKIENKPLILVQRMLKQIATLFSKPYVYNTLKLSTIQFGAFASSSGFIMWFPDILNKMNNFLEAHGDNTASVCQILQWDKNKSMHYDFRVLMTAIDDMECSDEVNEDVFPTSIVLGIVFTFGYVFNAFLIDTVGKKLLLVSNIFVTGACGLMINFTSNYLSIVSLSGIFMLVGTSVNLATTITVDLYPTQYRALATSITLMTGRIGAVVACHLIGYLLDVNCPLTFYIFAVQHIAMVVIALSISLPLFICAKKKEKHEI